MVVASGLLRIFIFGAYVWVLVTWLDWGHHNPRKWGYVLPPASVAANVILFFGVNLLFPNLIPALWLNLWSMVIYLQAAILLIAVRMIIGNGYPDKPADGKES